jgi:aryl-alcohol dehydrogenase-like predicted oxidoreductase
MLRAFDDLVRQGKVRYTGCSNYEAWRVMEAMWISDTRGLERFACHQPQYSLVVRDIEEEIVPACELKGLGIVCWSPLAGGYLAGKYRPGEANVAGTRSAEGWAFPSRFFAPQAEKALAELLAISTRLDRSPAEVALRWVLDRPFMTSAIVGARNEAQLRQSLEATGWRLPEAEYERLEQISAPPRRYPRSMEDGMAERRAAGLKMPRLRSG